MPSRSFAVAALALALCATSAAASSSSGRAAGPYVIKVEELFKCEDEGEALYTYESKLERFNLTHYTVDISVTLNEAFGDDQQAIIYMRKWSNLSGWNSNAFQYISGSPCTDCIKYGKDTFVEFLTRAGLKPECPIPKGKYKASGFMVQNYLREFPEMPYGKYQLTVTYMKKFKKIGCWGAVISFEEK